jgi:hypothetical protein
MDCHSLLLEHRGARENAEGKGGNITVVVGAVVKSSQ